LQSIYLQRANLGISSKLCLEHYWEQHPPSPTPKQGEKMSLFYLY
jgi:hypothetical protein